MEEQIISHMASRMRAGSTYSIGVFQEDTFHFAVISPSVVFDIWKTHPADMSLEKIFSGLLKTYDTAESTPRCPPSSKC